jgi:YD repeat-containing protein
MHQTWTRWNSRIVALVVVLSATAAVAQNNERYWYDHSQGITATIPADARVVDAQLLGNPDALVRFVGPRGQSDYRITITVKNNPRAAPMENVMETAKSEIAISAIDFTIEHEAIEQINDLPVGLLYCRHLNRHRSVQADIIGNAAPKPWVMGQAFIARSADTLIVVTLDVDEDMFNRGRDVFERLIRNMSIEDVDRLSERRKELVQRGIDWRSRLDYDKLLAACIDEQLFRITQGGNDIGYLRVRQRPDEQMQFSGIRIDMQARIFKDTSTVDSQSNFFLSQELSTEFWSVRITERPLNPGNRTAAPGMGESTYLETGLRSHDRIEVTVEDAFGKKFHNWQTPLAGYIAQVELLLLGQLAADVGPAAQEADAGVGDMGFYAYFSAANTLSFRTERIERNADGSYRLLTRPNPGRPQYVTQYDAQGRFLRQELPDGSVMVPTTRAELAARWHYGLD